MYYDPCEPCYRNGEFIQLGAWKESEETTPVSSSSVPMTPVSDGRRILWEA
jgi:hypothetical protein